MSDKIEKLEKMLRLKQDDELRLCREIDGLKAKLADAEKRARELEEAKASAVALWHAEVKDNDKLRSDLADMEKRALEAEHTVFNQAHVWKEAVAKADKLWARVKELESQIANHGDIVTRQAKENTKLLSDLARALREGK